MQSIREIMTESVCTIHRDKLVCEVEGIFIEHEISGAPLVDADGRIVGIISKSDIIHFDFTGGDPNEARAWEIASPRVITVDASVSVAEAARKLLDEHIHRLVVTDGERTVGVVSSLDFVKLILDGNTGS
jgi:CBS domain-containing protein